MVESSLLRSMGVGALILIATFALIACGSTPARPEPDVVPVSSLLGSWNHEDTLGVSRHTFGEDHTFTAHFAGQSFNADPLNHTLTGKWTDQEDSRFAVSIDNCTSEPCGYLYWFEDGALNLSLPDGSAPSTLTRAPGQGGICQDGYVEEEATPVSCADPDNPSQPAPCEALEVGAKDLSGCDLSGLDLSYSEFAAVDFTNVNLQDADLTDTNLDGANMTNANLTGAELAGANIADIRWDNTICPDGANTGPHPGTPCTP